LCIDSRKVFDSGIYCISKLPKLLHLHLDSLSEITGQHLKNMSNLRKLSCHWCEKIEAWNIFQLINNLRNIVSINLYCCKKILNLILMEYIFDAKSYKLTIHNDTSKIEDDLLINRCTVMKFMDTILVKIEKRCVDYLRYTINHRQCNCCCNIVQKIFKS
jgi:hypothetical protein